MSFHYALVFVRLLIVLLGSVVVYLTLKSHRHNHSNAMLLLSIGFALITIGAVIEGVLFEFLGYDILEALMIGSVIGALGFTAIIYSIFGTRT